MSSYRIGFTGTQMGMTDPQKSALRSFLVENGQGEFHHGDCVGADSEAHDIADDCGYGIILHPPTNYSKRAWRDVPHFMMRAEKPYLTRNKCIVEETFVLVAAPLDAQEQARSGTWSTVRYARKRDKGIVLILPDGTVKTS